MKKLLEYEKYKESRIDWMGDIPSHWTFAGLNKVVSSIVDYRGKTPEKVSDGIFLVTARNIKQGRINYSLSQEYVKEEEYDEIMRRGKPRIGDVLFTTEAPLGEVANVDREDIALAQRVIKFRGKKGILDNYYLKYWIESQGFQSYLASLATGSTATGIKASKLSLLTVLLPPIDEQKKIAEYLDQKTEEIDGLIDVKERLIGLLEEKMQAIITEVVTRGINPDIELKDSGVKWIGMIPKHWNVKRLGYFGRTQNGISKSSSEFGFGTPFVSYGDVYSNMELPSEVEGLVNASNTDINTYSVKKGDVFFTRTSETIEEIGIASTCMKTIENATFAGFLIRFRPNNNKELTPDYSKYYFRSLLSRKYFVREMNIVTRASLGQDLLKSFSVLLPPIEEQIKIGHYLDCKTKDIKETIKLLKKQIQRLKEYRQSIIYEAVTGKIDLRNYSFEGKEETHVN